MLATVTLKFVSSRNDEGVGFPRFTPNFLKEKKYLQTVLREFFLEMNIEENFYVNMFKTF